MVFQSPALYPHMTAFENMAFGLRVRHAGLAEIRERVGQAASLLGLEGLLERKPMELSGGERQRVALGRAIVRRPKLFLLDEPLSNLDSPSRVQLRAEIARLQAALHTPMIYVTHDHAEAMRLGHRVAVLHKGALQQVGEPMAVYARPANLFVAGFIGSPPMNFFAGAIAAEHSQAVFHADGLALPVPADRAGSLAVGSQVVLGLRPEHIVIQIKPAPSRGLLVEAAVERVEPTGPQAHIYLLAGPHRCVASAPGTATPAASEKVSLAFQMTEAHFFDAGTGSRLA